MGKECDSEGMGEIWGRSGEYVMNWKKCGKGKYGAKYERNYSFTTTYHMQLGSQYIVY